MRITLSILFLIMSSQLRAQVSLENLSLKDTKVKEMYKGWNNTLKIISNDTNVVYELRAKHSEVIKHRINKKNEFLVSVRKYGTDTLEIVKNGKIIKTVFFECKRIPKFKPWIAFPNKKELTVEQIIANPKLYSSPPQLNLKTFFRISGYNVIIIDRSGEVIYSEYNRSQKFSPNLIKQVKQLKPKSVIILSDIRGTGPDRFCNLNLGDLKILIK